MKKFNLICLGFFSISSLIAATTQTIYLNFYEQVIIRQKDGESYSRQYSEGIGKDTIPQYPLSTFIYRSVFKFDLSDIDDHAIINSVTVYTNCSGSGYTFRLTKISSLSPGDSEIWNEIGAGTVLCSGLDYGNNVTNSDAFKTAIQNALVSDELIVGALSEAETTIGSASDVYIQLEIEYTVPLLSLQAKNDLYGVNGGNIGVGVKDNF